MNDAQQKKMFLRTGKFPAIRKGRVVTFKIFVDLEKAFTSF